MEIKEETEDMMKSIIDVQQYHREQIENLYSAVESIRATMMTNLRFELQEEMTKCILRGYRTPKDTEYIEAKFHDYKYNLNGNHGVESLYNNDFLKLPVKEKHRRRILLWNLFMK